MSKSLCGLNGFYIKPICHQKWANSTLSSSIKTSTGRKLEKNLAEQFNEEKIVRNRGSKARLILYDHGEDQKTLLQNDVR